MSEARDGDLIAARHALITQRLRRRRDDLGLTQKQIVTRLARCGLQTTNRALSSLEHGSGLDVAKLPELALALDCTVTYLIGLTDDPHRWQPDDETESVSSRAGSAPTPAARRHAGPTPSSGVSAAPRVSPESLILGAFLPETLRERDRRQPPPG